MIFVVGGGGRGSLKDTDAILTVTVPTGSTVTATKGGTTLTPTMWVQAADNTKDCALFVISPSLFDSVNPWTVTATRSGDTASGTVTISSNEQYDIGFLPYHVPTGYQEVEYIEATGTQYINYGISPAVIFSTELEFALTSTSKCMAFSINNTNGGGSGYRLGISSDTSRRFYLWIGADESQTLTIPTPYSIGEFVTLKYSQGSGFQKFEIGSESVTGSFNTAAKTACWSFLYKGDSDYYGRGRLKHSKLRNDGTLVRDMWACYRKSDSVAGMWDKVSQTFFTNAGSGVFTVGPDV